MKKRFLLRIFVFLLLLISFYNSFGQTETIKPCREQPSLIGECFFVKGRLSLYNGNPTFRLWRIGTTRILGVSDSYSQEGYSNIPEEIKSQLNWENEMWGNFLVCPFTHRKPKVMQFICIESGKNLVVRKRK